MSGMIPSFVTGANAKIKIGSKTIAYAQDVSYNTTVSTIPIEAMGRYEVVSNEPIAYFVEGTLSIIRYTKGSQTATGTSIKTLAGATPNGNGVGNVETGTGATADQHFDPSKLITSKTFDLTVYRKNPGDPELIITLTDCRFTRKGSALTKRGIWVEQFAFNAILAGDDSFPSNGLPGNSGDVDGQP